MIRHLLDKSRYAAPSSLRLVLPAALLCNVLALTMTGCGPIEDSSSSSGDAASGSASATTKRGEPIGTAKEVATLGDVSSRIMYADTRDPRTLDPAHFEDYYDNFVGGILHEGLVGFSETDTEIVPALAESWEIADDGLSATFTLRDATFHNGAPVRSYDVKYSLTRILDPATASLRTWMFDQYLTGFDSVEEGAAEAYANYVNNGMPAGETDPGITGIETPDEKTVVFRFNRPYLPFLTMLAMPNAVVIPVGSGAELEANGTWPPGAGPWKLVEWERGDRLLTERFDEYWEGPAAEKEFLYRAIAEFSTWRVEFDTKKVDLYTVSEPDYRKWRTDPERKKIMVKVPELCIYYVAFNVESEKVKDLRVREAIDLAVDSDAIFEYINLAKGVRASGPVPPDIVGHEKREPVGVDRERAKALLKEAGVAEGTKITLYYPHHDLYPKICQAVRTDCQKIGLEIELRPLDRPAFREALRNKEADMFLGNWWADYPDIENFIFPLYHSTAIGDSNHMNYSDPEVDALIDEARFNPNPEKRLELFNKAENKIIAARPQIFLWHRSSYFAVQDRLENFVPHPMINGLDFHEVRIEE